MYLASSWVMPAWKPVGWPPVVEARENTWLATVPPRISWSLSLMGLARASAEIASSSTTGPEARTSAMGGPSSSAPPSPPPRSGPSRVSEEQAARPTRGRAAAAATTARRQGRKLVRVMDLSDVSSRSGRGGGVWVKGAPVIGAGQWARILLRKAVARSERGGGENADGYAGSRVHA